MDASKPPGPSCIDAGATVSATPIPLGVYSKCDTTAVEGNETAGGPGGTVTLTESNGVLDVEIGSDAFAFSGGELSFTPIADSAAIVVPGQSYGLSVVPCATSTATTGVLASDGQSIVISLLGGGCGDTIGGFITCSLPDPQGQSIVPPDPCASPAASADCVCTDAGAPAFPSGVYGECTSSIPGYGGGQITLSESRGDWAASLSGIDFVANGDATLTFSPKTASTALLPPGQALTVSELGWITCSGPGPNDSGLIIDPGLVDRSVTTTSGSLVVDGSTLFLFLAGTDECGSPVEESIHCTAQ
jgi:hypothetical protein